MAEDQLKLVVIIASDVDGDRLIKRLVQRGCPATKVGGVGGFLRRGNSTILSGVPARDVESVLEVVREECHARQEFVPVQTLPFPGDSATYADPLEVRVGGAVVFVLNVDRFEKT
ncbi:MAG: cyclic-di-AMP receptor [Dehalococcoidia bacterium]